MLCYVTLCYVTLSTTCYRDSFTFSCYVMLYAMLCYVMLRSPRPVTGRALPFRVMLCYEYKTAVKW
jgi:hypothetical protein